MRQRHMDSPQQQQQQQQQQQRPQTANGAGAPGAVASPMIISPELLLRQLYETVTDFAILTMDTDARITSWNAGAHQIFQYERHEVLGNSAAITFTPEDIAGGQPYTEMACAASKGRAADYRWHQRKDGSHFWADGVMTPIRDAQGQLGGYLKILRDITERKAAQDEIDRLATIDSLTLLYNRAAFDTRRNELSASALRNGQKLLLFMIDLDRFKEVNDTYGHQAGDQLLAEVARRLRAICRESDILARIGGDEFALLQLNPTSPLLGANLARKMIAALNRPFQIGKSEVYVSGSIGIAVYPDDADSADGLLKNADLALYAAKAAGRNGYHYFTESLDLAAHRRNIDQMEIRRLAHEGRFWLAYQPIVDAVSGQTVAMEALLRFPDQVLSSPGVDYLIELAKEIGLIVDIGAWVFSNACGALQQWRAQGLPGVKIAVNTCAKELLDAGYLPVLLGVLERKQLTPADVDLELTEHDAIELDHSAAQVLPRLAQLGFGIVLDDFGTGYSSLSYLRALPVTGLKLDKSFLRDVPANGDANAVTRAVVTLARDLRLAVSAEGVENGMQADFLRDAGCHAFQGFLFAAPMSGEDAAHWLQLRQSSAGQAGQAPAH